MVRRPYGVWTHLAGRWVAFFSPPPHPLPQDAAANNSNVSERRSEVKDRTLLDVKNNARRHNECGRPLQRLVGMG